MLRLALVATLAFAPAAFAQSQQGGGGSTELLQALIDRAGGPSVDDYLRCVSGCNDTLSDNVELATECVTGCKDTQTMSGGGSGGSGN